MSKLQEERFKMVAVGDGAVGKTCLLVCYAQGKFPEMYIPTVFDNYHAQVQYEDRLCRIDIWDTAGQEDLSSLRHLSYPETDLFLICYSIIEPTSFENIRTHWAKELKDNAPIESKTLLVATKLDLREEPSVLRELKEDDQVPVSRDEGEKLAKEIGAVGYVETSAKTMKGVKEAFTMAIHHLIHPESPNPGKDDDDTGCKIKIFASMSSKKAVSDDISTFLGEK